MIQVHKAYHKTYIIDIVFSSANFLFSGPKTKRPYLKKKQKKDRKTIFNSAHYEGSR